MLVRSLPKTIPLVSLPTLKKIDRNFKDWEEWMIPGRIFKTRRNTVTIVGFSRNGSCFVRFNKYPDVHSYRLESVKRLLTIHSPNSPSPCLLSEGGKNA
ncbi:MAG TPA: hypothetical protein VFM18_15535 [Methanosarcina sp.]|nr:hypothetical protein [Methanosarcina sp.]